MEILNVVCYTVSLKIHVYENCCKQKNMNYNPFLVYCRDLVPGTVSLTGDRAQGDDNKHDSHYTPCYGCYTSHTVKETRSVTMNIFRKKFFSF